MSGIVKVCFTREYVLWTSCSIDLTMWLAVMLLFTCQTKALVFCALSSVQRALVHNNWCYVSMRVCGWRRWIHGSLVSACRECRVIIDPSMLILVELLLAVADEGAHFLRAAVC